MNIGVVGLGLIGGSLGWSLRSLGHQVLGISRKKQTCQIAVEWGIVNDASIDLDLLSTADVIFICTPIEAITPTVRQIIPYLPAHAIVTDVGSVKAPIVETIASLWPNFVGGHPMAGTAASGIEAASRDLFVGKAYVLTPTEITPPEALNTVDEIARSLFAVVHHCSPVDHDRAVAWISHLPVMVSAGLIETCMSETDPSVLKLAQHLASSGFRDTSRVGGGNPELGVMMAKYNRIHLLRSLQHYQQQLDQFIYLIEQENWHVLEQHLQKAQIARTHFL